jgi:hypothetical protein
MADEYDSETALLTDEDRKKKVQNPVLKKLQGEGLTAAESDGQKTTGVGKHREYVKSTSAADVARAEATGRMTDTTLLGAKKSGRGMLPNESVSEWKQRLSKMDEGQ